MARRPTNRRSEAGLCAKPKLDDLLRSLHRRGDAGEIDRTVPVLDRDRDPARQQFACRIVLGFEMLSRGERWRGASHFLTK